MLVELLGLSIKIHVAFNIPLVLSRHQITHELDELGVLFPRPARRQDSDTLCPVLQLGRKHMRLRVEDKGITSKIHTKVKKSCVPNKLTIFYLELYLKFSANTSLMRVYREEYTNNTHISTVEYLRDV